MVAVLLVPLALLVTTCLLAVLERRLVAQPPGAGVAPGRSDLAAAPASPAAAVAGVVPLRPDRAGLDGDTLRLRRAA